MKPSMDQIRDLENLIENLRKNFSNMAKLDDRISEIAKQIVGFFFSLKQNQFT